MQRSGRMVVLPVVASLVIIAAAVIAAFFWYEGANYVTETDAQVTAPMAPVGALSLGTLTAWEAYVGEHVTAGQRLGAVLVPAPAAIRPSGARAAAVGGAVEYVDAPLTGTVVQSSAVRGQTVQPGVPLAYVADLSAPSVTAYIPETKIRDIQPGEAVDVYVDAVPGTTFSGTVKSVGLATAATFSLLPAAPQSGSFTKVVQRIPVSIAVSGARDLVLPGESATVRIHIVK